MKLTSRDRTRLQGVHPDLVRVIERAAADPACPDFMVIEGIRTVARQRKLVAIGASKTMNSRHIPAPDGHGHAVDLAPLVSGRPSWDWPLYYQLAPVVKAAARAEGVPIEWGGDWRSFKDGPHWQLPWKAYPGSSKRVAGFEPYTELTDTQDNTRRLAIAGAGVSTGAGSAAEPAVHLLDAMVQQQGEISSGDIARVVVGGVIIALTLWLAFGRRRNA